MNENLEQHEGIGGIGVLALILLFGIVWMFTHPQEVNKRFEQKWDRHTYYHNYKQVNR